ncbi:MAG: rod shape-determining protein MreD [Candidatus Marinimicrobia bacterium]|nr:rod shape-determining protein MreD [Candidatus Neomarinimicrobiota bacterium]
MKKYGVILIIAFLLQIFLSNLFSIRGVRPDFLIIFVLYFAVNFGSFKGVLVGFSVGIIASLFDSGMTIGILPLIYSIVGYSGGFLKSQHYKMIPLYFNFSCFLIIIGCFFIYSYFNYNYLFYNDFKIFLLTWFKTALYTVSLLAIVQFIVPLRST